MFPFGLLTATPPETVTLLGTAGAPIIRNEFGFSESGETYHIQFNLCSVTSAPNSLTRGKMEKAGYKEGISAVFTEIHDWVTPNDYQEGPYYVRLTAFADTAPDFSSHAVNGTTWHDMTGTNVYFGWSHNGPIIREGVVKVEIATDSGGSNIVATGYYRGRVNSSP